MHVYVGTFLIAFTTLALEVTLTRLLSVITWYHLAFFAISTAMLGMTAGAVTVYLRPPWFAAEKVSRSVALACLGYAVATPVSLILLCMIPLVLMRSIMGFLSILVVTMVCVLPFYFSGIAISAALTKFACNIGRLYASDLIGAALGCLLVIVGLEALGAPSLILLSAALGALAALVFQSDAGASTPRLRGAATTTLLVLVALTALNTSTRYGITPIVIKGEMVDPSAHLLERWNSFSRVAVFPRRQTAPQYWGPSPTAPQGPVAQYYMDIDGSAATTVRRFASNDDVDHLRFDITNVVYYLRPHGGAAIIGVGGGRDIQAALLFGHEKVTGIDVNPIFINLLRHEFREFAGVGRRDEVRLIVDEARSYMSRAAERYSVIQMSLVDTWAATGAGAFSLSENALYTVEAWKVFYGRLADDGIFTVSRWYNPVNLGETGRIVSLAVASLLESGVKEPERHVAMLTVGQLSTILVGKRAFSERDIATLREVSARLAYRPVIVPGIAPAIEVLARIVSARSLEQLRQVSAAEPLDYTPATDENPYFFNMLRLGHLAAAFGSQEGIAHGNLRATIVLLGLIVSLSIVASVTIILPLWVSRDASRSPGAASVSWESACYFSLIGAGFMLVEIGLIQRLSVFLGHPVYALGILLFSIIASTGVGSFISAGFPVTERRWMYALPIVTVGAIVAVQWLLPGIVAAMITASMAKKIAIAIGSVVPLGILLGCFFPTGMRMVNAKGDAGAPWYWALNGVFGVLCSALAVFIAIYFGISTNFYMGAVCYGMLLLCLPRMGRRVSSRR